MAFDRNLCDYRSQPLIYYIGMHLIVTKITIITKICYTT